MNRIKWRLREFFGRKSTFFSNCILKDSPFSCDHFDGKVVVKDWPEAEKNRKNIPKISINYHTFVTTSMTSSLWVIPELKVLHLKLWYSDFFDDPTTWWRSRAIWKIFVSWLSVATTWSNHLKIFVVPSLGFYLFR